MAVRPQPRLFTVEEYHRMGEAGILGEDDRVELIYGEIVQMTAIGSRHAACVKRLLAAFSRHFADRAIVQVQDPVQASDLSEPEPDVVLLRPRDDFYASGHPRPGDVLLMVEVADSSLDYDRTIKAPLYAATGVAELWIVNLNAGQIEAYRGAGPDGYAEVHRAGRPGSLAPLAFPEIPLAVEDILGPG
jgi:Uma2 family endonuclease